MRIDLNKNKKSIMVYAEQIQKAYTLLMEKHIKANAIVINKNLVYVPQNIYRTKTSMVEFPPMICGLEIKESDDLPEDYAFIVTEVAETEREKYGEKVRKETAKEIYNWLNEHAYYEEEIQLVNAFHEAFLEDEE